MTIIITYLAMLIFFLVVDALMIFKIIAPMFQSNLSSIMKDNVNYLAAAGFYLFYVAGIYWFGTNVGIKSGSAFIGASSAAFLGLLAYATYEVTSFSIIKGWTLQMVAVDVLWGGILSCLTALVGIYVHRILS